MDRLAVLEQVVQNQNEAIKELKAEIEALKATLENYVLIAILKREITLIDSQIQELNTCLSCESVYSFPQQVIEKSENELIRLGKIKDARKAKIEELKAEMAEKETV